VGDRVGAEVAVEDQPAGPAEGRVRHVLRAEAVGGGHVGDADHERAVVVDPVGVAKAARLGRLPGLHTFTPNRDELRAWAGTDDADSALAHAHEQGIEVVWLRDGADGSTLHTTNASVSIRLRPAPVVDVTGAGDAMLAAYVHRLRAGDPVVDAGWFAAAAAWLTVGSASAVRADLTEDLVVATLEDLR
jgi:pseudouridine kinase